MSRRSVGANNTLRAARGSAVVLAGQVGDGSPTAVDVACTDAGQSARRAAGVGALDGRDLVLVARVGDVVVLAVLGLPEEAVAVAVLEEVAVAVVDAIAAQLYHV